MKLESLIIIFLLIIIPITMVLSQYIDKKLETEKKEISYNTKLLNSTHDAIKEYQLRTVNNEFSYDTNNKILDIESAINTFFTSLGSNFGYSGYNTEAMKEYVPAVAFTLYDGYYIYSPYRNTLTEVEKGKEGAETAHDNYDPDYSEDGVNYYGLNPYVYYSCRYTQSNGNDFVITYTLDNYITIQGIINNTYVYDYGYLYGIGDEENCIKKVGDSYVYNDVTFTKDDKEELKEFVGDTLYSYVKINGKKYYLQEGENKKFFYIEKSGDLNYSQFENEADRTKAYSAITENISAYEYYKNAYEFSERVLKDGDLSNQKDKMGTEITEGYNLKNLMSANAINYDSLKEFGNFNIFDDNPQLENSNFNKHRKSIIRYVVESNLLPAITAYASTSNSVDEFLMPKISDSDWDLIENNVCAVSFMQGMNIGSKKYNGYSVVANTLTKEYVDKNDIYIVQGDTYYRVNDSSLVIDLTSLDKKLKWDETTNKFTGVNFNEGFYAGILKLDFEQKRILNSEKQTLYYYPQKLLGSYTSIFGSSKIKHVNIDKLHNDYFKRLDDYESVESDFEKNLKKIYYYALGRERWSSFNINNVNFENNSGSVLGYFLNSY